jgi:hypothetical protein
MTLSRLMPLAVLLVAACGRNKDADDACNTCNAPLHTHHTHIGDDDDDDDDPVVVFDTATGPTSAAQLPQTCDTYCDMVSEVCSGLYDDVAACLDACEAFDTGGFPGDLDGDSLQCRIAWAWEADTQPDACLAAAADGGGVCGEQPPAPGSIDLPHELDLSAGAGTVRIDIEAGGDSVWVRLDLASASDVTAVTVPADGSTDGCAGNSVLSLFLFEDTSGQPHASNDDIDASNACSSIDPRRHPSSMENLPAGTHLIEVASFDDDHRLGPIDLEVIPFTSGVEGDACSDSPGGTCQASYVCSDSVCVDEPGFGDDDGDGFIAASAGGSDCDDSDATVHPAASELCDGVDQDCDGLIDEGLTFVDTYADDDGDGFGSGIAMVACSVPAGSVTVDGDCDDTDPLVHPAAAEDCNEIDDDCDGVVDDGLISFDYYVDLDGDGYGGGAPSSGCDQPMGTVTVGGDCDDSTASVSPAALESCNGIDDDCDGALDEEAFDAILRYVDADGDGFGAGEGTASCTPTPGTSTVGTDCDDTVSTSHPNGVEVCNGVDDDCSGFADDGPDGDGDGTPDICDACPLTAAGVGHDALCPAASCQAVLDADPTTPDGDYWLDPDATGAVLATCDMVTDGGGWTKVFGYEVTDDSFVVPTPSDLGPGIELARQGMGHVSESGLASLRAATGFGELRMHCAKPDVGRTLHITTDNLGVLDWLSGQSDIQPTATQSFTTMPDDTSMVVSRTAEWGHTNGVYFIDAWGHHPPSGGAPDRLTDHTVFVDKAHHWLLDGAIRQECDDYQVTDPTDNNGSWSMWVR